METKKKVYILFKYDKWDEEDYILGIYESKADAIEEKEKHTTRKNKLYSNYHIED